MPHSIPFLFKYARTPFEKPVSSGSDTTQVNDAVDERPKPPPGTTFTRVERETTDDN